MGAQSYPGAVWAPVTLSRRIGNSPRNPELFAQSWFFFSQSRPGAPPCHIGSQVWFLNRRPTHFPAGEFGKRESRESSPKNGDSKRGRIFPRARYRESGLGQRVVPRLFFRATRGQEKATLWRLPDLAVNFQVLHTCARGRRAEGAASTRRPVLFGAANPNGRVGNGAGTRRGAPFRERARRRAARRHRARRRLVFRNRVTSLGDARRWRAPRPRTCTCCSWTTTGRVVPSSRACSRSATTRVSPESRPARVDAKNHVTSLQSVDVVFPPRWTPPARAPERRSD
jgi:hypothetical protein